MSTTMVGRQLRTAWGWVLADGILPWSAEEGHVHPNSGEVANSRTSYGVSEILSRR